MSDDPKGAPPGTQAESPTRAFSLKLDGWMQELASDFEPAGDAAPADAAAPPADAPAPPAEGAAAPDPDPTATPAAPVDPAKR